MSRAASLPLAAALKRLAVLWFVGAGLVFVLVFALGLTAESKEDMSRLWSWFLPSVMPTVSLIIGVQVSYARAGPAPSGSAPSFMYGLAFWLSVTYLALVSFTLLLKPFNVMPWFEYLDASSLWLAPLQMLATGALGAFYVGPEGKSP